MRRAPNGTAVMTSRSTKERAKGFVREGPSKKGRDNRLQGSFINRERASKIVASRG